MQYLLMIHQDEKVMQAASKEEASARFAAYGSYVNAMKEAGAYVGDERLHPSSTATVVRARHRCGPHADVREQLGGYYLIEAPDLEGRSPGRPGAPQPRPARSRSS